MDDVTYIPTMSRYANLKKVVPRWLEQDIPVRLVVEPDEYLDHVKLRDEMGWKFDVAVLAVQRRRGGMGYLRNFIVQHAQRFGRDAIVMAEDDLKPTSTSDMHALFDAAREPGAVGVGATHSLHERFTGGKINGCHGVIMCPGGWGFQLFAVNVAQVVRLGGYDERLYACHEDAQMARLGIAAGMPWRLHCDVRVETIGTRFSPGGLSAHFGTREARNEGELVCQRIVHEYWPEFSSDPDQGRFRFSWQKMLDAYIPDWRRQSALHGGSLNGNSS